MPTAPRFWGEPPGILADLLSPIGMVWDAAGRLREVISRPYCPPIPVVCIGNLVAGGAGKTPVAQALAVDLAERSVAVHVVTRGYGGSLDGPLQVDPAGHDAAAVGDEALLLALRAPCWVARKRVAGMQAAVAAGARAILLDDGFQNPTIAKTLSLVVVDATYGFGNGRVLPAGPLRESLARGLARADAVVLLGGEAEAKVPKGVSIVLPVLSAVLSPVAGERLAGRRLFAFAGIGRPAKFFASLHALGAVLVGSRAFPDHHPYGAREIDRLRSDADRQQARLVTTAKDIVRVPPSHRTEIEVLEVEVRWRDPAALAALIDPILARATADAD